MVTVTGQLVSLQRPLLGARLAYLDLLVESQHNNAPGQNARPAQLNPVRQDPGPQRRGLLLGVVSDTVHHSARPEPE
jgi:hypothetical protein